MRARHLPLDWAISSLEGSDGLDSDGDPLVLGRADDAIAMRSGDPVQKCRDGVAMEVRERCDRRSRPPQTANYSVDQALRPNRSRARCRTRGGCTRLSQMAHSQSNRSASPDPTVAGQRRRVREPNAPRLVRREPPGSAGSGPVEERGIARPRSSENASRIPGRAGTLPTTGSGSATPRLYLFAIRPFMQS